MIKRQGSTTVVVAIRENDLSSVLQTTSDLLPLPVIRSERLRGGVVTANRICAPLL